MSGCLGLGLDMGTNCKMSNCLVKRNCSSAGLCLWLDKSKIW